MNTDNRLYKTEADVIEFFISVSSGPHISTNQAKKEKGIMIDSKLRREILTGPNSGRITINGWVESYIFKDLKGGVWNCRITESR